MSMVAVRAKTYSAVISSEGNSEHKRWIDMHGKPIESPIMQNESHASRLVRYTIGTSPVP